MRKKSFILGVMIVFFSISASYAGTLGWKATGSNFLYDQDNSTKLAVGCLVQLILDVAGDGLDSIEFTDSSGPAGDDILMPNTSGGNTGAIGDGVPPFDVLGHFSISTIFDNADPVPNYTGYNVYVRFWNAASPGNGDHYGESDAHILVAGFMPQEFNIVSGGSLSTNIQLVSEPRGSLLMLSGLIPVLIIGYSSFNKKKNKNKNRKC